jgi:YegS/Rv2252/BmrU family lipid kinase
MSVFVIINPVSGARGRAAPVGARVDLARRVAAECGETVDVIVTERGGHAGELARDARTRGERLVVAWGGDGTINEVAAALAFGNVPLGIMPAGSGNGLSRALGIPFEPAAALSAALKGRPRAIDAGELGGRFFVNVAGVGFDARIAERFNSPQNRRRGLWGYAALVAREALGYEAARYTITTPDGSASLRAWLVVLANGNEFGNRMCIAPHARVDDGRLDLVVVHDRSRFGTVWGMRRLLTRSVERAPQWSSRQVERATITSEQPMMFHVDGEAVQGGTTLEAKIHPNALLVSA